MKLSIAMMVKNEEKYLEDCLKSLIPILESIKSELIIVDTGSEDKTVEIAKRYTDKLFFHEWQNDFSKMRNITIEYCTGEWIFIVDGDEVLEHPNLITQFLLSKESRTYNTGFITVKNITSEFDETSYTKLLSPRLFKNDGKFHYEGSVHNQPIYKKPFIEIKSSLMHYGYISTDKELMEKKFLRTSKLLISELEKDPENVYYLYQLSVTYGMHDDVDKELSPITKAYEIYKRKKLNPKGCMFIFNHLALVYLKHEKFKEAEEVCKEAIEINNEYIDLYHYLARAQVELGKTTEAIGNYKIYLSMVEKYNNAQASSDSSIIHYTLGKVEETYYNLCVLSEKIEKPELGLKYGIKISNRKLLQGIIPNIIESYFKLNMYKELREYFETKILSYEDEIVDRFLLVLEDKRLRMLDDKNYEIANVFSNGSFTYFLLNNIRVKKWNNELEIDKQLEEKILTLNFEDLPIYYGDILYYLLVSNYDISNILLNVKEAKINDYFNYLFKRFKDLPNIIGDYLEVQNSETVFKQSRINKLLSRYILIIDQLNHKKYRSVFERYLKEGSYYLQHIYSKFIVENERIYDVKNEEESFFIFMIKAMEVRDSDKAEYIGYLRKALNVYPYMKKGIEILLEDFKNEVDSTKDEFEEYDIKVKNIIRNYVENGQLTEAKEIITEYEKIVENDVEICSMKVTMAIMKGNFQEAEQLIKSGLEKDPYNKDLLFNMSYLMDNKKDSENALKYYCRAKLFNPDSNVKVKDIISDLKLIDNNKLKVINGTMEIANQMHTITRGLKKLGIDAKTLNYYPNYLGYKADYVLDVNSFNDINKANMETKKIASRIISENDVFHFHFGTSLTLDHSDLPLLKELGKKVVMQYWGSDVRMYSKAVKLNPYVNVKDMNEDGIKRKLELISKFIPDCIVDYEVAEYVKDYHSNIHYTRVAIDLNKYKFIKETYNKKLLIVHAPTSPEFKGSNYILKAINELKNKYDFDFKLVQGMSHEDATKIYEQADLIIDQVLAGAYGVFAVETMAMGKPVISWISNFMKEKYPKDLPIISANPDTIKEKIEYVIKNKDMLKEIGISGRKYVEKYHDMNKISTNMLEIYKGL